MRLQPLSSIMRWGKVARNTLALWLVWASFAFAVPDEVYVAYTTGNDTTGDGSSGTPWSTIQKALDTVNHGGDGVRINVKAGETQVLATVLTTTTYLATNGAGSATEPLIIQGYTATAGDGGIGTIEGTTNNVAIWTGADSEQHDYVHLRDLSMTSEQASGYAIIVDNGAIISNCTLVSNFGGIDIDQGIVENCTITWDTLNAILGSGSVGAYNNKCILTNATIRDGLLVGTAAGNIIDLRTGTTNAARTGIQLQQAGGISEHNTIIAAVASGSSTASGIYTDIPGSRIANNYIHGFNSTGNYAIRLAANAANSSVRGNACFNCTAGIENSTLGTIGQTSLSNLAGSGVTNAGTGDFSPTSYLIDAGYPMSIGGINNYPTIGAITTQHSAGGSNIVDPLSGSIPGL